MLSSWQIFEDNIRPADLLLKVFRLLQHDALNTKEALVRSLQELVKAEADESLLAALNNPLGLIAKKLGRTENKIKETLDSTVKRRNDIVHRADRSQEDPAGSAQEIGFPWAKQAVETIRVVCLAVNDLVTTRLKELKEQGAEAHPQGAV